LLHVSLALRIGGDVSGALPWQQWGGVLNAAAVLLFLAKKRPRDPSRTTPFSASFLNLALFPEALSHFCE
jgi:hypothetical protein